MIPADEDTMLVVPIICACPRRRASSEPFQRGEYAVGKPCPACREIVATAVTGEVSQDG